MDKQAKKEILNYIISNPRSHLRKIKNDVGYSMGTTQYHLNHLENEGEIKSKKTKFYKYFYHKFEKNTNRKLDLQPKIRQKIIRFLDKNESATHRQITEFLGVSSSTTTWHMRKLIEVNIVKIQHYKKFRIYQINN